MSQDPLGTRLYRSIIRPIAFGMDPEKAHYRTMGVFGIGLGIPGVGGALRHSMDPSALVCAGPLVWNRLMCPPELYDSRP